MGVSTDGILMARLFWNARSPCCDESLKTTASHYGAASVFNSHVKNTARRLCARHDGHAGSLAKALHAVFPTHIHSLSPPVVSSLCHGNHAVRSFTAAETRTLLRVRFMTLIFQLNVPNPEFWGERALFYRCSFYPLSGAE